jgi:tetratricopeptide (TPR) repeat protein
LDALSGILSEEKKYPEAENALSDALAIYTALDGSERAKNPFYLGRLASLAAHDRFAEAERIYQDVSALERSKDGLEHPQTLRELADVYRLAKDYTASEALYLRIIQSSPKPGDGFALGAIERLGAVYEEQRKFDEAGALYVNAVQDSQRVLPHGHLVLIANLDDLASFYARQYRLPEADEYYRLALAQFDAFPADGELMDHNLAIVMSHYASVLRQENRTDEAEQYENRSMTIDERIRRALPACQSEN